MMMSQMIDLRVQRLTDTAIVPRKAHASDAAHDLFADVDTTIPLGKTKVIPTGIALELFDNMCALVMSRSGLAAKHSVFVLNSPGLIDPGYRGEIHVILHNSGEEDFVVSRGDRIAQLFFNIIAVVHLNDGQTLNETDRGSAGLGSTGISLLHDDDYDLTTPI